MKRELTVYLYMVLFTFINLLLYNRTP